MAGRGTRLAKGKENCLVLDFAGNVKRHGPIDLVKRKRPGSGDGDAPVKVCPDCDSIVAAAALECPDCGFIFPARKVKVAPTASTLAVLSSAKSRRPEWLQVNDVTYHRHDKQGGRPSLKVTYQCGLARHTEWICLEHTGYPRTKAEMWWRERAPGVPVPRSVDAALALTNRLRRPSHISVRPSGNYTEITNARFDTCHTPTPGSARSAIASPAASAGSSRTTGSPIPAGTKAGSIFAAASARTSVTGGRA
jgi:DNA repair protein RadD